MIENKTIFIAHNWSDVSVNQQSKFLALKLSEKNKVVFLSSKKNGLNGQTINKNLTIYEWPNKKPNKWKDYYLCWKLCKQYKPDIAISHFSANNVMLFVSWLSGVAFRLGYYHTTVDQYTVDNGRLGLRQKLNIQAKSLFLKLATHIICPSSYAAESIVKDYRVQQQKVVVVPNALPEKQQKNNGESDGLGFIGRLHKSKGVDILVKAFISIASSIPSVPLIIAGTGEEERALKEMVGHAGLENRVVWLGKVGYDKIFELLTNINCLVVPSRIDNLPTVVLEAFSCAVPVIAAKTGGITDMVQNEYNGFLFESENIEQLAACLQKITVDKAKRNAMAQAAVQTFNEKFLIDTYPERLLSATGIK